MEKNPISDPIEVAKWKQKCSEYLYDFYTCPKGQHPRWEGVGCTCDPRIEVTYEHHFPHTVQLTSSFHTKKQGVGYLRDWGGRVYPGGIECMVGAHDEIDLWKRFYRVMKLAFENNDSYKVYCIRKKKLTEKVYEDYYKSDKKNRNDWLDKRRDELEDELLDYAESLNKA